MYASRRIVWHWNVLLVSGCVFALLTLGCTTTRVVHDGWGFMRQLADPSSEREKRGDRKPLSVAETGWAILIQTFRGPDRHDQAQDLMRRLLREAHIPDLWVKHEAGLTHVYRSRYETAAEASAQADLQHIRTVRLRGDQTFAHAHFVPLGPESRNTNDPLNLRQHTGLYTLQIGYYDDQFGPDFRQAAETASRNLRSDEIEAFFYHGRHRSLVTVGLFGEEAFVRAGPVRVYSPQVKALQKQFPYNLGNGRTLIEKEGGKKIGEQPSFLVRVP